MKTMRMIAIVIVLCWAVYLLYSAIYPEMPEFKDALHILKRLPVDNSIIRAEQYNEALDYLTQSIFEFDLYVFSVSNNTIWVTWRNPAHQWINRIGLNGSNHASMEIEIKSDDTELLRSLKHGDRLHVVGIISCYAFEAGTFSRYAWDTWVFNCILQPATIEVNK